MSNIVSCNENKGVKLLSYFVYILSCSDGTLYTGITNDLENRVAVHNSGKGAKYTAGRSPVSLVYQEFCENKSIALHRELEIKKMTRERKLQLIETEPTLFNKK